jgi:SNF2 family DNA or RNA helicase
MKLVYLTNSYKDNNELCEEAGKIIETLKQSIKGDPDIKDQINNLISFKHKANIDTRHIDNVTEAINREIDRLEKAMQKQYCAKVAKVEAFVKRELLYIMFP